jgi:hypothetical protein
MGQGRGRGIWASAQCTTSTLNILIEIYLFDSANNTEELSHFIT